MNAKRLYLGCTKFRHAQLGVHAVINARSGRPDLNDRSPDEIELYRDAEFIRRPNGGFWRGPCSRFFRRHRDRIAHTISDPNDYR